MALPTEHELVSLQSLTGTVLHDDGEGVYRLPFEAWIGGRPRTVTAVLQRTAVYLVPELEDRRLALLGDVLVDPDSVVRLRGEDRLRRARRLARGRGLLESQAALRVMDCDVCGKAFETSRRNQRYCHNPCAPRTPTEARLMAKAPGGCLWWPS